MPTLETMVAGVYRDLADETQEVFSTLQIEDFIRGGIVELNRIAPLDTYDLIELTVDDTTGRVTAAAYNTTIELPYKVTLYRHDGTWNDLIPEIDPGGPGTTGYNFQRTPTGGTIGFPQWLINWIDPTLYGIHITGYAKRPLPYVAAAETGLAEDEEYLVRSYAKSQGYDLLAHDRSMFAQWQGQTNNTDVSPTQIMQMAGNAAQEWDRQRGLNRVVRRYW